MIFISFTKGIEKIYQFIISLLGLTDGLGFFWMIVISDSIGGTYYYAGLIMAIIYAHGIIRLRFIYTSLTTWVIVIIYEIYIFAYSSTPSIVRINNSFFLT